MCAHHCPKDFTWIIFSNALKTLYVKSCCYTSFIDEQTETPVR